MTANITLRLDQKTLDRVRHIAVDQRTSVSAWVSELVTRAVDELDGFNLARMQALRDMAEPVQVRDASMLGRADAHER